MTKILVTGATGFIGTHLVTQLHSRQYEVFQLNSKLGHIADSMVWKIFPGAEVVVHLAAKTFVPDSWINPLSFFNTNFEGTVQSLEYCRKNNARLVFLSSYLYGVPNAVPISESADLKPNNPYALSKKLAEDTCQFYSSFYDIDVTILRLFNIYGPRQDNRFLIPSIINQVLYKESVQVKDLDPRRDYVYIDDLVNSILYAIESPQRFDIFNIGSGISYSVAEVISLIQQLAGTNLPVYSEAERRAQEVMDTKANIDHIYEVLNWKPKWSLQEGLSAVLKEYQ